jgi:hypothetical protein
MKLVAIVRTPTSPDEAARAVADAAGVALAEARMRLAREPPALLARLEPAKAGALVAALRRAGLAAVAVDDHCPTDKDRTVARSFAFDDTRITFTPRFGDAMEVEWAEVTAILRGLRALRSEVERTERSTTVSVPGAVATGGLAMTRKKTVRSSDESIEQVILVYERGGRAATLAERELDFSCLGAGMQASSTANMVALARQLREKAKGAFYDERLLRLCRRPLPFLVGGESRSQAATVSTTRTDTTRALDTLAELMRQALMESLLP